MALRLAIAGVGGRMGREIAAVAAADADFEIVGGTIRPGRAGGGSFSEVAGVGPPSALLTENMADLLDRTDVVVDFTTPEATVENARRVADAGRALVVGTTGLGDRAMAEIRSCAERVPILYGRNMSVGIAALVRLLPLFARALAGYDIEITEAHHRYKKDAPSGTALALGEAIAAELGVSLAGVAVHGRSGIQPRASGEIGFHALRAGGNAGEHTVLFADEGEQIQIVHRAYSRRTFALGALRAARWVNGRPAGLYGLADIL